MQNIETHKQKIKNEIKKLIISLQNNIGSKISRYDVVSFLIGYYGKITKTTWKIINELYYENIIKE